MREFLLLAVATLLTTGTLHAQPEIDLFAPDGSALASGGTNIAYGTQLSAGSTGTFTIGNNGATALTLSGAPVVVTPVSNCSASCIAQPASTIGATGQDTFDLLVQPSLGGAWSFTVSITNNDSNESPYTFTVTGTAQSSVAPEMDVEYLGAATPDGGTESVVNTGVAPFSRVYTILNLGAAPLSLTGSPDRVVTSNFANCTAAVTAQPGATLSQAGWVATTDTFTVLISPLAPGAFSFRVSIANNDADEDPYNWTYNGNTGAGGGGGGDGGGDESSCSTEAGSYGWLALAGLLSMLVVGSRIRRAREDWLAAAACRG